MNGGCTIAEISAYVVACVFDESTLVLLMFMNALVINCGCNKHIGTLENLF